MRSSLGVGLVRLTMHKWGFVPWANYAATEQKSKRPITYYKLPVPCTTLQMGHLVLRLSMITVDWLKTTALNI